MYFFLVSQSASVAGKIVLESAQRGLEGPLVFYHHREHVVDLWPRETLDVPFGILHRVMHEPHYEFTAVYGVLLRGLLEVPLRASVDHPHFHAPGVGIQMPPNTHDIL